jgi:hypothetical protein
MRSKTRIGNERDYCGRLAGGGRKDACLGWHRPAWRARRSACQEGSTRFLCRYGSALSGKRKGPSQAKREACAAIGYVHSFSFICYFFFLHIHVRSTLLVPSTSKHTPLPEGSTMAAPAPHLSKGKGKHERQNK